VQVTVDREEDAVREENGERTTGEQGGKLEMMEGTVGGDRMEDNREGNHRLVAGRVGRATMTTLW
jgi:hypothetical protein